MKNRKSLSPKFSKFSSPRMNKEDSISKISNDNKRDGTYVGKKNSQETGAYGGELQKYKTPFGHHSINSIKRKNGELEFSSSKKKHIFGSSSIDTNSQTNSNNISIITYGKHNSKNNPFKRSNRYFFHYFYLLHYIF